MKAHLLFLIAITACGAPRLRIHSPDAGDVFDQLRRCNITVLQLGTDRRLVVPPSLRFTEVDAKVAVRKIAAAGDLSVVWLNEGHSAILQRGAPESLVKRLISDIGSEDRRIVAKAAARAGDVGDCRVLAPLLIAADSHPTAMASICALGLDCLAVVCGNNAFAFMKKLASDPRSPFRMQAIAALGLIRPRESSVSFIKKLTTDPSRRVRLGAIAALGTAGATELLIDQMNNAVPEIRHAAVEALARGRDPRAIPLFARICTEEEIAEYCIVIRSLRHWADPGALALVLSAADSDAPVLRRYALQVLAHSDIPDREKRFLALSRSKNEAEAAVALTGLGAVGGERALQALGRGVIQDNNVVKRAAIQGLCAIGNDRALRMLVPVATHPSRNVRMVLASALADVGTGAVDLLAKLVSDQEMLVRLAAAQTLAGIPGERAASLLIKRLANENSAAVRLRIAGILARRPEKRLEIEYALSMSGLLQQCHLSDSWASEILCFLMSSRPSAVAINDQGYLAFAVVEGKILVCDPLGYPVKTIQSPCSPVVAVALALSGIDPARCHGVDWESISNVALSKNHSQLVMTSTAGEVTTVNLVNNRVLHRFSAGRGARCLALDGERDTVALGYGDGTVELWGLGTGKKIRSFKAHDFSVRTVNFAVDGTLLTGGADLLLKVWKAEGQKPIRSYTGHSGPVVLARFIEGTRKMVSLGRDGRLLEWNLKDGGRRLIAGGLTLGQAAVSADGRKAVIVDPAGYVRVFKTQ